MAAKQLRLTSKQVSSAMDSNGGGSAPTSSKRPGPFVDITNVINAKLINKRATVIQCEINVPKDHENCQQINKNSTSKIQRASTILDLHSDFVVQAMKITLLSLGMCMKMHEDVTNLSTAELKGSVLERGTHH
uniref:Uncharacterized protein n=1 Tax=Oryza rufipogon TaxID=4529 RepID=A0A0E0N776_ORYRU